jgi:hypothetical protein
LAQNNDTSTPDSVDDQNTTHTLAHEIGHGIDMPHWRKDTSNSSDECTELSLMRELTLTVMIGCWFQRTTNVADPKWTSIPHDYDQTDLNRLRIKR